MARTEVQRYAEAIVQASVALQAAIEADPDPHNLNFRVRRERADWHDATTLYRGAVARQEIGAAEAYLRNGSKPVDREAAARAMISRPGWRSAIYGLIRASAAGMSDRGLEEICIAQRGNIYCGVEIPNRHATHQSISSARKSLVDAGLLYAFDTFTYPDGSRHTRWKATTPERLAP